MKRTLLITTLVALGAATASANDYTYPYLIFTGSDGTQTTLSVASLEITFADGQLVATNGDGSTTLTLADLISMQFSESGEVTPVTPTKQESALTLDSDETEYVITLGDEFTAPRVSNPNALTLTWTSSDESVAKVDADGQVTIVGTGTTAITATFEGNDSYEAGSVSYSLTVNEAEEDAIAGITSQTPVKVYTAAGIYVGTFETMAQAKSALHRGLYVISANNRNFKLSIK